MSTSHIVNLLIEERDRLNLAISALGGEESNVPDWVKPSFKISPETTAPVRKRRSMNAAARRRIGEATRARWAARKSALAKAVAPTTEDAEFKNKLGDVLKKATRRKKTAAKKKAGK